MYQASFDIQHKMLWFVFIVFNTSIRPTLLLIVITAQTDEVVIWKYFILLHYISCLVGINYVIFRLLGSIFEEPMATDS